MRGEIESYSLLNRVRRRKRTKKKQHALFNIEKWKSLEVNLNIEFIDFYEIAEIVLWDFDEIKKKKKKKIVKAPSVIDYE